MSHKTSVDRQGVVALAQLPPVRSVTRRSPRPAAAPPGARQGAATRRAMQSLAAYAGGSPGSSGSSSPARAPPSALALPCAAPAVASPATATPAAAAAAPAAAATAARVRASAVVHVDAAAFDAQLHGFVEPAAKRPRRVGQAGGGVGSGAEGGRSVGGGRARSGDGKDGKGGKGGKGEEGGRAGAVFLPTSEERMRGRWWDAPKGSRTFAELEVYRAYVPKREVWAGKGVHGGKGVNCVKWVPGHGHLLASAGMDGVVKVWRAEGDGVERLKVARAYSGHQKGVRDASWRSDGRQVLTAGWDKSVLLWDVETGKVVGSFRGSGGMMPYCVVYNPEEENEYMVGCSDKKALQLDVRDGNGIVQTYEHMGAVNSITFVDENRRFVSSSDDKVIRVWDVGIPICLKYISDPTMHSCPVTVLHPNTKWISCQSMDNNVRVYGVLDKFKLNTKKHFNGHLVAGYAAGLTYSPDGRFMASGDAMGRAFFWDWKSSRMIRTLQGHKGVCIDVAWHPTVPSRVVTCGWDGNIKLWD